MSAFSRLVQSLNKPCELLEFPNWWVSLAGALRKGGSPDVGQGDSTAGKETANPKKDQLEPAQDVQDHPVVGPSSSRRRKGGNAPWNTQNGGPTEPSGKSVNLSDRFALVPKGGTRSWVKVGAEVGCANLIKQIYI